jgi:hypothetical protein
VASAEQKTRSASAYGLPADARDFIFLQAARFIGDDDAIYY